MTRDQKMRTGSAARHRVAGRRRGFTLIELMVSIGIMLVLGVMIIGFLRGALSMTRTGTARGKVYEAAQTTLRLLQDDLEQVIGAPPSPDGPVQDLAFTVAQDPWGRQLLMFTRAWGEEQGSLAGYDSGRAAPQQGYNVDFNGLNVNAAMRASRGNIEVVWMMEPAGNSLRLYRAERSPPGQGGLVDAISAWLAQHTGPRISAPDDLVPGAWLRENNLGGLPIWDSFELVSDDVVGLSIECWDDWLGRTQTWYAGPTGPVTSWLISRRLAEGQYALPRAVRATLLIAAADPIRAETTLLGEVSRGDSSLGVDDTANFPDVTSPLAYLRVNGELMAYAQRSGGTFGSLARGALGTRATDHAPGSLVVSGTGFQRVIQFPVSR